MDDRPGRAIAPALLAGRGALAGAVAALVFTAVHQWMISRIWFAFPAMLVAGVACGASLAGTYGIVSRRPSVRGWLEFNGWFLVILVGLGVTSLAAFAPVTTIAELLREQRPPSELIGRALPMTGGFVVSASLLLALRYRARPAGVLAIVATTALIVVLLGLNISILGFVSVQRSERFVLWEVFALLATILGSFSLVVLALGRGRLDAGRDS
jgi:hypothetical protein